MNRVETRMMATDLDSNLTITESFYIPEIEWQRMSREDYEDFVDKIWANFIKGKNYTSVKAQLI